MKLINSLNKTDYYCKEYQKPVKPFYILAVILRLPCKNNIRIGRNFTGFPCKINLRVVRYFTGFPCKINLRVARNFTVFSWHPG